MRDIPSSVSTLSMERCHQPPDAFRRRFARLAKSENPYCDPNAPSVTVAGLAEAVEGGPLAERVLGAFDQDADGTMSANEALEAMQVILLTVWVRALPSSLLRSGAASHPLLSCP